MYGSVNFVNVMTLSLVDMTLVCQNLDKSFLYMDKLKKNLIKSVQSKVFTRILSPSLCFRFKARTSGAMDLLDFNFTLLRYCNGVLSGA